MALKGVIFDFDGVIVNTEGLHLRAFQDVLDGTGLILTRSAYFERYLGFDDLGVFAELAKDRGMMLGDTAISALIARKAKRFETLVETDLVPFAGATECICNLSSSIPLGIASGAFHDEIERILTAIHLRDQFDVIVAADDVEHAKPAPDCYRDAVAGLSPGADKPAWSSWVAIEDSHWGLEAARAAGLKSVGVTNSYPATSLAIADVVVDHLSTVDLDFLERLCA